MTNAKDQSEKAIGQAFLLNLIFTIIEIIGGFLTGSVAILSDALHDMGDSVALGISWYLQRYSQREQDREFTYGYRRFSLLGAIINGTVLFAGALFVIYHAIPMLDDTRVINTPGMIGLAILGIIVNGLGVFGLRHSHGVNSEMAKWHLLEDVLGWVAILIAAILLHYFQWSWLDPSLAILIAMVTLYRVYKMFRKSGKIILQGIPEEVDLEKLTGVLMEVDEVIDVHDIRIWSLDGEENVFTAHVVVPDKHLSSLSGLKVKIANRLKSYNVHHFTLEFETQEEAKHC